MNTILRILAFVFVASTSSAQNQSPIEILFDDFDDLDAINGLPPGGYWYSYDDSLDGGGSKISPKSLDSIPFRISDNCGYPDTLSGCIHVVIDLKKGIPYPYAGFGCNIQQRGTRPLLYDLTQYHGVKFYCKGNNEFFLFKVKSTKTKDGFEFQYSFRAHPSWTQINIPFTNLFQPPFTADADTVSRQEALTNALAISFQTKGNLISGKNQRDYEIWIDEIKLLR